MNFKFSADEQKVIDLIHEFGVNEVAPLAAEIDEQERFPQEHRNRLAELGMMGICYPKEYGGAGHSYLAYIAVIEELASHCSTTSVMLSDHHSLGSFPCQRRFKIVRKRRPNFVVSRRGMQQLQAFPCSKRVLTICCFWRINSFRSFNLYDSPLILTTVQ